MVPCGIPHFDELMRQRGISAAYVCTDRAAIAVAPSGRSRGARETHDADPQPVRHAAVHCRDGRNGRRAIADGAGLLARQDALRRAHHRQRRPTQLHGDARGPQRHRAFAAGHDVHRCAEVRAQSRDRRAAAGQLRPDLGTALGRASRDPQPLQRTHRHPARADRAEARFRRGLPALRRRARLPLCVPRPAGTGSAQHRRGAHRVHPCRRRHRLVDPGVRMEPRGIPLPHHSAAAGGRRADAHHLAHRRRPARVDPRSGAGRLFRHEPDPRGGAQAQGRAHAGQRHRGEGFGGHALQHAVAHAADRTARGRPGGVIADPQPQRTQSPWRCVLGQADEVRRRVVGNAPGPQDLGLRCEARRHQRERAAPHRLRRRAWFWRRAGGGSIHTSR